MCSGAARCSGRCHVTIGLDTVRAQVATSIERKVKGLMVLGGAPSAAHPTSNPRALHPTLGLRC